MLKGIARPALKYIRSASSKANKNAFEDVLCSSLSVYKGLRAYFQSSDSHLLSATYLRYRNIERSLVQGRLGFVTFDDLVACTNHWIRSLPEPYDVIVGIPRSGLLVANIIASKLGKPLTTPDRLAASSVWMTQRARRESMEFRNILLVDDRVSKGRELRRALAMLENRREYKITKASLFVTPEAVGLVDVYYKIIPDPVLFEWNLLHSKIGVLATDLDGVICHDPPKRLDADEPAYLEWMRNARPYLIPAYEIDAIVSSRLERYRAETERWLAKHGVVYKQLILWDLASIEERRSKFGQYKADMLLRLKPDLYWESNQNEAKQIYDSTKIPTLCIDRMFLLA